MFDILSAILYGEDMNLPDKAALEPPYSLPEERICGVLETLDEASALRLRANIRALVHGQHSAGFLSGARFGAQLMLQLLEGF